MTKAKYHPLAGYQRIPDADMVARVEGFFEEMARRRTVRDFAPDPVPRVVIEAAIATAGRAPSGANKQPWHFVAVSSADIKRRIREAAEEEERAFYGGRAGGEWLADLAHLGTDEHKPFLETAPWLIVCFKALYGEDAETGERETNYYVHESAGIACGFLIAALHRAGLATLTHTPSPMKFLSEICGRPKNEKAMMIIVAGHPAPGAEVPVITKKTLEEISTWL